MRILISSPAFLPHLGGLEINMATMAEELAALGNEIVVLTRTPGAGPEPTAYSVVRGPSPLSVLRWMRWSDVYHQANVSLREFWPMLIIPRPWVVSHHSWYCRPNGERIWKDNLKRFLLKFAAESIAVSRAMADDLESPSVVVENAYRSQFFRRLEGITRANDLVFVGRLVSDKGVDLLLDALALLRACGRTVQLTLVGDGPEEEPLRAQARRLGLLDQVVWRGALRGEEVVRELNAHAVLVVPSRYQEPFGLVALEGAACGCVVVGSAGGGLADAIGPCGITFPNGDVEALAEALGRALDDDELRQRCLAAAPAHLEAHSPASRARRYHEIMQDAVDRFPLWRERGVGF